MVERAVLLEEINTLPPRYYKDILDFVGYLKKKETSKNISLEKAAKMSAEEYRTRPALIINDDALGKLPIKSSPRDYSVKKRYTCGTL